jgi:hypothetical protein
MAGDDRKDVEALVAVLASTQVGTGRENASDGARRGCLTALKQINRRADLSLRC